MDLGLQTELERKMHWEDEKAGRESIWMCVASGKAEGSPETLRR